MNNNLIKCSKISVDCIANDPVDIRCGGPDYLGFDFYVKEEQTREMQKFIYTSLETLEVPFINIYVSEKLFLYEKNTWSKEKIVEVIKNNATYIKEEAEKNYSSSCKR